MGWWEVKGILFTDFKNIEHVFDVYRYIFTELNKFESQDINMHHMNTVCFQILYYCFFFSKCFKLKCLLHYTYNLQEFSLQDYDYLVQGWNDKLVRTSQGDQRWGVFQATKPKKASLDNWSTLKCNWPLEEVLWRTEMQRKGGNVIVFLHYVDLILVFFSLWLTFKCKCL